MIIFQEEDDPHGHSLHGPYYGYAVTEDEVLAFNACSCFHEDGYHEGDTRRWKKEKVVKICKDSRYRDYPEYWVNEAHPVCEHTSTDGDSRNA